MLLAPSPPLLFMGEEWAAPNPFPFFCDFHDELADKVREGRRREFARFPAFRDPAARERIPDPNAEDTFRRAVLDWDCLAEQPHKARLALYRARSEEHTSELQSLMRNSYAVFCLKKKKNHKQTRQTKTKEEYLQK